MGEKAGQLVIFCSISYRNFKNLGELNSFAKEDRPAWKRINAQLLQMDN